MDGKRIRKNPFMLFCDDSSSHKKPLFNSTFCDLRTKFHFPVRLTLNYGEWIPAAEMAAAAAAAMKTN